MNAEEYLRVSEKRAADGLLDITLLQEQAITVQRTVGKPKNRHTVTLHLDGVEVFDEEFLDWVVRELDGISSENRLRFRLLIMAVLGGLKRGRHRP